MWLMIYVNVQKDFINRKENWFAKNATIVAKDAITMRINALHALKMLI